MTETSHPKPLRHEDGQQYAWSAGRKTKGEMSTQNSASSANVPGRYKCTSMKKARELDASSFCCERGVKEIVLVKRN